MLRKLGSMTFIAAGLFLSLTAQAATYSLGTLNAGDNEFGVYSVATSSFSDRLDFDLSNLSNLAGGVGSLKVTVGTVDKRDISNLAISIYDSANNLIPTSFASTSTNFALSASLAAGSYYAVVTGEGTGTLGGKYGGVLNVSPVPEPETWAMMAAGLGIMSRVVRRRKDAAANQA